MQRDETRHRTLRAFSTPEWWIRFAALLCLFVAWTGVGWEELSFGVVGAVLAALVVHRFRREDAGRFHPLGFARFLPYFLQVSIRGGIDVARRSFAPSMPLKPGFVDFGLRVNAAGPAAVFFAAVISLIPGTLCAVLDDERGCVCVHVIDVGSDYDGELRRLEERVGAIFGEMVE